MQLLQANGMPFDGPIMQRNLTRIAKHMDWTRETRVVVSKARRVDGKLWAEGNLLWGKPDGLGRMRFKIDPDGEYLVGALGLDFPCEFHPVNGRDRDGTGTLALRANLHNPTGHYSATVRHGFPRPSNGQGSIEHRLWLESVPYAIQLIEPRNRRGYLELDGILPEGIYRIAAKGTYGTRGCGQDPVVPALLGRQSTTIEVRQDSDVSEDLFLKPGGHITFEFVGAPSAEDWMAHAANTRPKRKGPGVRIELRSPDSPPVAVCWHLNGPTRPTVHQVWDMDAHRTSDMVPVGDFELVATLPSGRSCRQSITVEENRTTHVTIRFE
ncbi:MAG: hypothetical protein P1V35_16080 [Planctomycetota bacterium]|nr:hypothetical protein [Planctomycetota bacterium]